MDFIKAHFEALLTFIISVLSFMGVIYAKFTRLDKAEIKIEQLEKDINGHLLTRLDRIENKIDNFLTQKYGTQ